MIHARSAFSGPMPTQGVSRVLRQTCTYGLYGYHALMTTFALGTPNDEAVSEAMEEAYSLLPPKMNSPESNVMMLAIGLQESRFLHRKQIGGPAHGFWQFERGGGVKGVLTHPSSKAHAIAACVKLGVPPTVNAVYKALPTNDVLAAVFARLLLYTDAKSLPAIGKTQEAWNYYVRNWRPGKPHRHTWDALYARAVAA